MPTSSAMIRNHTLWLDTHGNPIDCHEGCILRVANRFYWYGRTYRGNVDGIYGTLGAPFRCGFVCYSSTNLADWTPLGDILTYPDSGWMTTGTWHRPRILFNPRTRQYVLWFFVLGIPDKPWVRDVVAVASHPEGPFTISHEPATEGYSPSGDIALLLEPDGTAYLANGDWDRNAYVSPLTPDFHHTAGPPVFALRADPSQNKVFEGVCLARYHNKYLLAASGVVGLAASETAYAVADTPLGPYREKGLMSQQKTWGSQIGSFFLLEETNCLLTLCDQWLTGPDGKSIKAEHSSQLWLPTRFDPATETATMEYHREWNPWTWK